MDKEVKVKFGSEGVESTSASFDKIDKSNKELAASLGKTSLAFTAVAAAGVAAMYQLIQASDAQEQAMRKLSAALDQTGQNTEEMTQKVIRFASNMQQLTGVADEELIPMISRLAMEFGNADDAIAVMPGLMAAAEIKGVSLSTVVRGVESALNGQTGALARYGIRLEDATDKQSVMNGILDQTNKFLPQLGIGTETLAGKLRVISANIADLMEPLGKALSDIFLPLAEWVRDFTVRIGPIVEALAPMIAKLLLVGTAISAIIAGITGVGAALYALPAAIKIVEIGFIGLFGILNAALGPAGWIVLGITAVISTVLLFKNEIGSLFNFIKTGATSVWNFLENIPILGWAFTAISTIKGWLVELYSWIVQYAKPVFTTVVEFAKWAAKGMYEVFAYAWNGLADTLNYGLDKYREAASKFGLPSTTMTVPLMPKTFEGAVRYVTGKSNFKVFEDGQGDTEQEADTTEEYFVSPAAAASGQEVGMGEYQQAYSGAYGGARSGTETTETTSISEVLFGSGASYPTQEELDIAALGGATVGNAEQQIQSYDSEISSLWSAYRTLERSQVTSLGTRGEEQKMDTILSLIGNLVTKKNQVINVTVNGSIMSENNLIENIKKGLKSGQSGDSFSF